MAVTDEAIAGIKQMILSGRVRPGEKLPKENELAVRLGLSRSSLREAVRALTVMGVLDVRQGDGTYVTSLEPHLLLRGTGFVLDLLQEQTLLELFEVRRLLEPGATALAAARMGDADLARLRECLRRMDTASTEEELVGADDEFHGIVADASGQPTLASLTRSFSGQTFRARIWRGIVDGGAVEQSKLRHHEIYRAIESRDPELARASATTHIAEVEFWFRRELERDETPVELDGGA